jgi:hypothetical protein
LLAYMQDLDLQTNDFGQALHISFVTRECQFRTEPEGTRKRVLLHSHECILPKTNEVLEEKLHACFNLLHAWRRCRNVANELTAVTPSLAAKHIP